MYNNYRGDKRKPSSAAFLHFFAADEKHSAKHNSFYNILLRWDRSETVSADAVFFLEKSAINSLTSTFLYAIL